MRGVTCAVVRLDLFSSGRLYTALEEAGYPDLPSPRTLRDWIANDSGPKSLRLFLAEMLGTTEEAPPPWAEGLEERLTLEVRANRETIVAALAARVGEAVGEALAGLPQPPLDEPVPAIQRPEE